MNYGLSLKQFLNPTEKPRSDQQLYELLGSPGLFSRRVTSKSRPDSGHSVGVASLGPGIWLNSEPYRNPRS
jgi:hypothetical protein